MIRIAAPLAPLHVEQIGASKLYRVGHAYSFWLMIDGVLTEVRFPQGWPYDRASIPTVAGIIVTKDRLGCKSPLLHDGIYRDKGVMAAFPDGEQATCFPPRIWTRREADEAFFRVMIADGVAAQDAVTAWRAVRMFARSW